MDEKGLMYGYLWSINILEVILLAVECFVALSAGLIFAIFPDHVQKYQAELRENPGRTVRWMSRFNPFHGLETRLINSRVYTTILMAVGYSLVLFSGVLAGFLVTFIIRV